MPVGHAPGSAVVGVTVAFTVLAFIATASRLITRVAIVRGAGIDDVMITIAVMFSIAITTTMVMQVQYGMGRHADTLSANDNKYSLVWFWASVWLYYLGLMFTKLSILFQYLRIFPDRRFRFWCISLMALVCGWTCWAFFSALFACWPIQHFWNPSIPGACLNRLAVWFSNAAMNIFTDIATTILPLPVLKSLNLPKRQRYVLMFVFGMGGVVCVISVLRLSSLYTISISTDVSWDNPLAAIWSSCEVNVGILCSCLPTLKGCVARYFPVLFSSACGSRPTGEFRALELSGRGRKNQPSCTISAVGSVPLTGERSSSKMARMKSRLGGRGEKDMEEGCSEDSESYYGRLTPTDRDHAIHVTTVVQQEEERSPRFAPMDGESLMGLVNQRPYGA